MREIIVAADGSGEFVAIQAAIDSIRVHITKNVNERINRVVARAAVPSVTGEVVT